MDGVDRREQAGEGKKRRVTEVVDPPQIGFEFRLMVRAFEVSRDSFEESWLR